jgi:Xaa-Pro aminopeptidase
MSEFCSYIYETKPPKLEYPWTFPMPSVKERDRRWSALRQTMNKHKIDCLIIGAPVNIFMPMPASYLYYVSNYVPFSNSGHYVLFPRQGEPWMVVHNNIGAQFLHTASQTSWIDDIAGSFDICRDIVKKIKQLKLGNGKLGIIGYSQGWFPALIYNALAENFPQAKIEDVSPVVNEVMNTISRHSEEELQFLRKSAEILDFSYEAVKKALKPGVPEYKLWAAAEEAIVGNGGWAGHFILGTSGPGPTFPKAPPAHNILKKGDVVIFEINVIYGGVNAQICFSLSLGKPEPEVLKMYKRCDELYEFSLAELEKKRKFIDIEQDLSERIHKAGYEPMTPQIHIYNMSGVMPMNSPAQPGDYFTVHPNMANKDFSKGAKFGDTVRIAKNGKVERLQKTPATLNIV